MKSTNEKATTVILSDLNTMSKIEVSDFADRLNGMKENLQRQIEEIEDIEGRGVQPENTYIVTPSFLRRFDGIYRILDNALDSIEDFTGLLIGETFRIKIRDLTTAALNDTLHFLEGFEDTEDDEEERADNGED